MDNNSNQQKCQANHKSFLDISLVVLVLIFVLSAMFFLQNSLYQKNNGETSNTENTLRANNKIDKEPVIEQGANLNAAESTSSRITQADSDNFPTATADNAKIKSLIRDCANKKSFLSQSTIDKSITNALKVKNSEYNNFALEGYDLVDMCKADSQILFLLNYGLKFKSGLSDSEIYKASGKSIIGVSDSEFNNIDFYLLSINDFGQGEAVATDCGFDKIIGNKILYICFTNSDNGSRKAWYAYDIVKKEIVKVKESAHIVGENDKTEIFNNKLLEFFSQQD
jgi:hypothetical protein